MHLEVRELARLAVLGQYAGVAQNTRRQGARRRATSVESTSEATRTTTSKRLAITSTSSSLRSILSSTSG